MIGYYYLHTNGELIFKKHMPDDSDFVRKIWKIDTEDRESAWRIILEALNLGANTNRIKELVKKWKCDAKDLIQYMIRIKNPTMAHQIGLRLYLERILNVDHNEWFNWLEKTPKGEEPNWDSMPINKIGENIS